MAKTAQLKLDDKDYVLPVMIGTEGEKAIDTRKLRADTGYIAYDQGYGNTGSCESQITYLDGDNGILRHRGYPIEQLAQHSSFVETAYLVIYGELPNAAQHKDFGDRLRKNAAIEPQMQTIFQGFPKDAPPMAMLSSIVASLAAHYPQLATNNFEKDLKNFDLAAAMAISKIRTIGAMIYRYQHGLPFMFPKQDLPFCDNFLHMMFSEPYQDYSRGARGREGAQPRSCCCTPTTSRTAPPRPCAWSAPARPISSRRCPPASARCPARCTAAPTSPSCRCCSRSTTRATTARASSPRRNPAARATG